MDSRAHPLAN